MTSKSWHSLVRAWKTFDANVGKWLIWIAYSYFCVIILTEVVRRYVFGDTSAWGEMTARYAFVYLVFVASAEAARTNSHIRIDLVPQLLRGWKRFLLYLYFDLLYLLLASLVIWYSIKVIQIQLMANILMSGLDLNMAFAYAALPLGWALLVYRVLQRFVATVSEYSKSGEVPLGGVGFDGH